MDARKIQYYSSYATVKTRGTTEKSSYMTIHKARVRIPGFEYLTEEEKERKKLLRQIMKDYAASTEEKEVDERFASSIARSRSAVVQLAANNEWEYFVTLTLSRDSAEFDAFNLDTVKKKLLQFLTDYARRSGKGYGFKYLLIPERHLDGAFHFHGLMMGINPDDLFVNKNGYLDFRPYAERFGHFSFGRDAKEHPEVVGDSMSLGKIRDLQKTASYISKYISKTMFESFDSAETYYEPGSHLYFVSKRLKKDKLEVKGEPLCGIADFVGVEVYDSEFCAKIPLESAEQGISLIRKFETAKFKTGVNIPNNLTEKQKKYLKNKQEIREHKQFYEKLYGRDSVQAVLRAWHEGRAVEEYWEELTPVEVRAIERMFIRLDEYIQQKLK